MERTRNLAENIYNAIFDEWGIDYDDDGYHLCPSIEIDIAIMIVGKKEFETIEKIIINCDLKLRNLEECEPDFNSDSPWVVPESKKKEIDEILSSCKNDCVDIIAKGVD